VGDWFATSFLLNGTPDSHPPECVIPDDVLIQFDPPDDEHLCSKHVEAWNKYMEKECDKLVINQNYVKMHGQQNIKNLRKTFLPIYQDALII
jgi:hypothetical protein